MKHMRECEAALSAIVKRHLTDKSQQRVSHVFEIFGDAQFLDAVFKPNSPHRDILANIIRDMNKAMDSGEL